jgi:hypothetical protein
MLLYMRVAWRRKILQKSEATLSHEQVSTAIQEGPGLDQYVLLYEEE